MSEIGSQSTTGASKKRLLTIADLDGRTNAAKTAKALIAEIESDLGGGDRLTAGEKAIVARAAVTTAMIEHMETAWLLGQGLDTNAYTALVNVQRRLLTTLGLQRRQRDVTPELGAYIATAVPPPPPAPAVPLPPLPVLR